jgi:hypothetical protein
MFMIVACQLTPKPIQEERRISFLVTEMNRDGSRVVKCVQQNVEGYRDGKITIFFIKKADQGIEKFT